MRSIYCPCCNSHDLKKVGKIPTQYSIGDLVLDLSLQKERYLFRCNVCFLYFVYTDLDNNILKNFYKNLQPNHWHDSLDDRFDWVYSKNFISKFLDKGSFILDVGCWDGRFLSALDSDFIKFGIELNPKASELAKKSGIHILKDDFSHIEVFEQKFDVITLFDIIEHVENPLLLLESLKRNLKANGIIIISTGDSENNLWKYFFKSKYYYCSIIEHISFINVKWLEYACKKIGLETIEIKKFSRHLEQRTIFIIRNLIQNLVFLLNPNVYYFIRRIKRKQVKEKVLPDLFNNKDHLLIVLKNKGDS